VIGMLKMPVIIVEKIEYYEQTLTQSRALTHMHTLTLLIIVK